MTITNELSAEEVAMKAMKNLLDKDVIKKGVKDESNYDDFCNELERLGVSELENDYSELFGYALFKSGVVK